MKILAVPPPRIRECELQGNLGGWRRLSLGPPIQQVKRMDWMFCRHDAADKLAWAEANWSTARHCVNAVPCGPEPCGSGDPAERGAGRLRTHPILRTNERRIDDIPGPTQRHGKG